MVNRVSLIGNGNWGSAVATIVGKNVCKYPALFDKTVRMWTYEEMVNGSKLSTIINTKHENPKYLPGIPIPENVIAEPSLLEATKDSNLLIFCIPHQFVRGVCDQLHNHLPSNARAISLIKGLDVSTGLTLISDVINQKLNIDCAALMGANIANEVAKGQFCETTIGYRDPESSDLWHKLFNTPSFRVSCVQDIYGVEICGALKNICAIGAGLVDGLNLGDNTKAAIMRIGLAEMKKFAKLFYPGVKDDTFFESCGVADVITTCSGGRNRKVAE